MTQRVFDIENEKDYTDLWDILPDDVVRIKKNEPNTEYCAFIYSDLALFINKMLKINWHDKTEITRPIQECTEQDFGKICVFYDRFDETDDEPDIYAVLHKIENRGNNTWYYTERGDYYAHCRRLTKQEIEELC
jgi:hypothetical protein